MKKIILTATFTGSDGSCGFVNGKQYSLAVTELKGNYVVKSTSEEPGLQQAEYESIFSFTANWNNIVITSHLTEERELTLGEQAVGISFNPGGSPAVNRVKKLCAHVIDAIEDQIKVAQTESNGEKIAQLKISKRDIQTGQMWAVKGITYPYKQ